MRKRGTVSRCCCADDNGAGVCGDACEYNWNGCVPSEEGQLFSINFPFENTLPAFQNAYANCGWLARVGGTAAFSPQVITLYGQDGTFTTRLDDHAGLYLSASVFKNFYFDYRQSTSVEFESTFEFSRQTLFSSSFFAESTINVFTTSPIRDFIIIRDASPTEQSVSALSLYAVTSGQLGQQAIFPGNKLKVKLVYTVGETIQTVQNNVTSFDGTGFVTDEYACRDLVSLVCEVYANDSLFTTFNTASWFFGKRCYTPCGFTFRTVDHELLTYGTSISVT